MAFPFSISNAYSIPAKPIIAVCTILLLCIFILSAHNRDTYKKPIAYIYIIQIVSALGLMLVHLDTAYINFALQLFIVFLIFLLLKDKLYIRFINHFINFIVIMAILSVITFFLCLVFNLSPYSEFINPDGRSGYNFLICFTNVFFDVGSFKIIRPSGFFDEPGTMAFYIVIAILLNDLTLDSNKKRIILIISGIFTLSIAFYFLLIIYLMFRMKMKYIPHLLGSLLLAAIISGILISRLDSEKQEVIYSYTLGRIDNLFSKQEESETYFKGDNRSDLIQLSLASIADSPIVGQGLSYSTNPKSVAYEGFVGANPLTLYAIHGLVGGIIFSLHVIYYFWICLNKIKFDLAIKSSLILLLLILQRPDYVGGILPYINIVLLLYATHKFRTNSARIHCNYSSI